MESHDCFALWWFDAGVLLSLFFNPFSRVFGLMAEWIFDISVWRWRYGWTDIWTDLKMSARVEKSSNMKLFTWFTTSQKA